MLRFISGLQHKLGEIRWLRWIVDAAYEIQKALFFLPEARQRYELSSTDRQSDLGEGRDVDFAQSVRLANVLQLDECCVHD